MALLKFLLFTALLFLGSCITEKKCWTKYPPNIIVKDSVVYKNIEVIIHDTLVIYGDTVISSDTVYLDKLTGLITSNKIYSETEYAKAYAQVINSKLFLELIQKDTAIERLIKENVQVKEVYVTKTVELKVWEVHWYDKVARIIAAIFLLAILVLVAINIIKAYIKPF
jgi:hypothetical protein